MPATPTSPPPLPGKSASPRPSAAATSRRATPRVEMKTQVDLHSESNLFTGFSSNLSEGGLFVTTVNLLPLGTEVDITFTLGGGQEMKASCVVRWRREVNDLLPDQLPGLGLQFVEVDAATLAAIHRFVAEREPLFLAD